MKKCPTQATRSLHRTLDEIRTLGGLTLAEVMASQGIGTVAARKRIDLLIERGHITLIRTENDIKKDQSARYQITEAGCATLKENRKKNLSSDHPNLFPGLPYP